MWLPLIYLGSVVTLFIAGFFVWGLGVIALGLCLGVLFLALAVFPPLNVPLNWVWETLIRHDMDPVLYLLLLLLNSLLLYRFGRYLDS